jgi:drug/metabolite transporter (DMT)-like permease
MRWKSDLLLLFVAAIWGSGFVAQRLATSQISTLYFNGSRFLLAALFVFVLSRATRRLFSDAIPVHSDQKQFLWMILAGVLLFSGSYFQQAGLETTTVGNASFITGLYVVLIPLILFIFGRQQISTYAWLAVGLAAVGGMLLSLQGKFQLAPGDALEMIGAVLWALHVILVGRLASRGIDPLRFSVIQFATCGLLNLGLAVVLEPQGLLSMVTAWQVIFYSALIPIGLGFTLQIFGQKHAPAVDAAIILSMEAVFGTFFGYLFLGELLSPRQLLGCLLILAAMILAQIRPGARLEVKAA